MSPLHTRSRILTFVAGFLAATTLSGVMPSIKAAVSGAIGGSVGKAFNYEQLAYFLGEDFVKKYDVIDHNGMADFAQIGRLAVTGEFVRMLFYTFDGSAVPDLCRVSLEAWIACGQNAADWVPLPIDAYDLLPEICDNGADEDGDELIDCADPQCARHPTCQVVTVSTETNCNDNDDEDLDGYMDCSDTDCATTNADCIERSATMNAQPATTDTTQAEEQPTVNNVQVDVMTDTNALQIPVTNTVVPIMPSSAATTNAVQMDTGDSQQETDIPPVPPEGYMYVWGFSTELCPNSFNPFSQGDSCRTWVLVPTTGDNSSEDDTDDTDSDFDSDSSEDINIIDVGGSDDSNRSEASDSDSSLHGAGGTEICNNSMDDNRNGFIDCNDTPGCGMSPFCDGEWSCIDSRDNDNNGKVDCADSYCTPHPSCMGIGAN